MTERNGKVMYNYYKGKGRGTVLFRISIEDKIPELYCGHGNWSKLDSFIWRLFETSKDRDKFIEAIKEEKAQSIIETKDRNLDRMESVIAATKG